MKTPSRPIPPRNVRTRRVVGTAVLGLLAMTALPAQPHGPTASEPPPALTAHDADRAGRPGAALALTEADIRASRIVHQAPGGLPAQPAAVFKGVNMMKLLVVIEAGDHHLTVLDGERFQPIHRLPTRPGLRGDPQVTPDGRYVFVATADGWLSKIDLWQLTVATEIRVGLTTHNIALSGDGRTLAVANAAPETLVLLDADLQVLKVHAVRNKDRTRSSRVLAVYDAPSRQSFVAVLQDVPEIWEVSYNPKAEDVPIGVIHDFLYKEGAFIPGFLNPRRSYLPQLVDDFFVLPGADELLTAHRGDERGQLVHLDVRKRIAAPELPGSPRLHAGVSWRHRAPGDAQDHLLMAAPGARQNLITVLDLDRGLPLRTLATPGLVSFLGSQDDTPYLWVATRTSDTASCLQLIDKRTLALAAAVPLPCEPSLRHVTFTHDGRHALVSLQGSRRHGGALVVFDASSLKEVRRIPMEAPVSAHALSRR